MSEFTLNTREAIGDFRRYDKKTQQRFKATLATFAQVAAGAMKDYLHSKVKNWTGNLGGSIHPEKEGDLTYAIGPDEFKIEYAWYIEKGLGSFKGYHYVRDGIKSIKNRFIKALKRDIERP